MNKVTSNENYQLHSFNDEPAVIYEDGIKYWYKNGIIHRETGAAVIYEDGTKQYWLNGKYYNFYEWISMVNLPEENKLEMVLEYEHT